MSDSCEIPRPHDAVKCSMLGGSSYGKALRALGVFVKLNPSVPGSKLRSTKTPHGCEVFLLKRSPEITLRQKHPTGVKCFCIVFFCIKNTIRVFTVFDPPTCYTLRRHVTDYVVFHQIFKYLQMGAPHTRPVQEEWNILCIRKE